MPAPFNSSISQQLNHSFVETNGVRLRVVQVGPVEGPLVLLLHGFPEFWYGWRHQMTALAGAGYRVWVPDQRGYNDSDKPVGIREYTIDKLAADVVGLIDAAGEERVRLVGHDWGAAVAWWVAIHYPNRLDKLVILNVPHPAVLPRFLWRRPRQLARSWYIFFFQVPFLPEWLAQLGNWRFLTQTLLRTSRPGTFSADDLDQYRQAWSKTGPTGVLAFRTMVNWYRAAVRLPKRPVNQRVSVPTLLIWGASDAFLERDMAPASQHWCDGGQLIFVEEATHWVHHEAAGEVNQRLLAFFETRPGMVSDE